MRRTFANTQPEVLAWFQGRPFAVAVLTVRAEGLAKIRLFSDPKVLERFEAALDEGK